MNMPTGQYCPPSIGMVAAFKLESLAGIVGIRTDREGFEPANPSASYLIGIP
jgi:hypothetical protein